MNRFVMTAVAVSSAIASPFVPPGAHAQTARDLVGTWTLVSTTAEQGGARIDVFGPDPAGTILFGPDGHYALIFIRRDLPRFAANTRPSGTQEENRAVVQGSIAHFGTYSVDEGGKTLVLRIEASTFPNWTGAEQRRAFALRGDQLTYTSPGSIGTPSEVTMRRVK
jgi:hypothetical protein